MWPGDCKMGKCWSRGLAGFGSTYQELGDIQLSVPVHTCRKCFNLFSCRWFGDDVPQPCKWDVTGEKARTHRTPTTPRNVKVCWRMSGLVVCNICEESAIMNEHAVACMWTVVVPEILYGQYMKARFRRCSEWVGHRCPKWAGVGVQKIDSDLLLQFRKAEGSNIYWPTSFFRIKRVDLDKTRVFGRGYNVSTRAYEREIPSAIREFMARESRVLSYY